jgi:acetyl esterase/lipase
MIWLLLLLSLAALAVSLLTEVRVPAAIDWKLAVLAGELGYALALWPLAVALVAWWGRNQAPGMTWLVLATCTLALVFLLKPAWQAWRLGRGLPARLTAAFGPVPAKSPAFALRNLVRSTPPAGPVQTHEFAAGLALDFYPAQVMDGRPAPCVVVIHGGGWDGGDRKQLTGLNHWLARQGCAVAAISYRLAPAHPWPAQREDVQAALDWLKSGAQRLGLDPTRLVLLGRSAGGQIASAVGFLGDPAVRGVVALYAPHDMRFAWSVSRPDDALNSLQLMRQYLGGPPEGREEIYDTASAQLLVTAGRTPPTLLIHGTIDTLVWVRHSRRLAARLAEAGVPHLLLELPWATHALEAHPGGPGGQLTVHALAHFLAAVTK